MVILGCAALLCGCSGKSETARVQELRDSIAALNRSIQAMKDNVSEARMDDAEYQYKGVDNLSKQKDAKDKWAGEYMTMDDKDRMWYITLNADETAVAKCEETGRSFYGSWRIEKSLDNEPNVDFSKPYPDIAFLHGSRQCFSIYFHDGYIYPTYTAARAKNPDNRLGILEDI